MPHRQDSTTPALPELRLLTGREPLIEHTKTGMLTVLVPGGKFLAGENPPFEVELDAFYIGVHPVTNWQYEHFVKATGHRAPERSDWGSPIWKDGKYPGEKRDHPVVCVSWDDAQEYCRWAELRLPRELEWEKAARGMDGRTYPWGNEWDGSRCRYEGNTNNGTTALMWQYARGASTYGAYNLCGNLWEWFEIGVYAQYKLRDLRPPNCGKYGVLKGGAWRTPRSSSLAASYRYSHVPGSGDVITGFRCMSE